MSNELTIKLTADGGAFVRGLSQAEGGLRRIETAATAAGRGLDNFNRAARASQTLVSGAAREVRHLASEYGRLETAAARAVRQTSTLGRPGGSAFGGVAAGLGVAGLATAGVSLATGQFSAGVAGYRERSASETFLRSASVLSGTSLGRNQAIASRFGAQYGLGLAQANQVTAQAARFTAAAGRPQDTEKYLQRLADLAAATGQSLNDLPTLISQISAGTDEATDKLFAANPSVIYDRYAASVGKTAAALSDAEKKQALLNAVMADGARVAGAANERLNTTLGLYDRMVTKLGELRTQFTKTVLEQPGYQDAARGATGLASYLTGTAGGQRVLDRVASGSAGGLTGLLAGGQRAYDYFNPPTGALDYLTGLRDQGGALAGRLLTGARAYVPGPDVPLAQRLPFLDYDARKRGGVYDQFGQPGEQLTGVVNELERLRSRYQNDQNPLVAILRSGRMEAAKLKQDIAKLPFELQQFGPELLREQARGTQYEFASQIPSAIRGISSLGARYEEITRQKFLPGGGVGYARESGLDRVNRVLRDADTIERLTGNVLSTNEAFSAGEVSRLARRAKNELITGELAGLDPNSPLLDSATRAAYGQALNESRTERIQELAESISVNRAISANTAATAKDVANLSRDFAVVTNLLRNVDPRNLESAIAKLTEGVKIEVTNRSDRQASLSSSTLFSSFDGAGDPTLEGGNL